MKVALALLLAGNSLLLAPAPARMQVSATEYSFAFSRTQLHPGKATIELANFGMDPHDLRIQRVGARHIAGLPVVAPGGHADLTLTLRRGRYLFWCSIANHRKLGMRGVLTVR
jgi:plastocyanin